MHNSTRSVVNRGPAWASLLRVSHTDTEYQPDRLYPTLEQKHLCIKHLIQLVLFGPRPQAYKHQAEYSRGSELISQKLATGQSPGDRPFLGMCRVWAAQACWVNSFHAQCWSLRSLVRHGEEGTQEVSFYAPDFLHEAVSSLVHQGEEYLVDCSMVLGIPGHSWFI